MTDGCWNCKQVGDKVSSERTGIEYCLNCGAAVNGRGWITAMNEVQIEDEGAVLKNE
jgi:ribosomal protein L37AE/L43A